MMHLAKHERTSLAVVAGLLIVSAGTTVARADWPTSGGDGGRVVEVTTIADAGQGSLRAALASEGKRHIVFKVGGEIFLTRPLDVRNPYVTIAGETAPSPGISLLGDKFRIRTHDVIVRDLRIRVGELAGSDPSGRDGISIDRLNKGEHVRNILIDRCSVAWAVDEGIAVWGVGARNVLIRRTIVAETLRRSLHTKVEHSMGLLVGWGVRDVVIERNLLAHNMYRNPAIAGGASAVVINNLIYDPGAAGFQVYVRPGAGPTIVSVVGNVLIAGPGSRSLLRSFAQGLNPGSKIYYRDNRSIGATAFEATELAGRTASDAVPFVDAAPIWFDWLKPLPSGRVEDEVLADVGARRHDRDDVDARIISEVLGRTGSIRDMPTDLRLSVPRPVPEKDALSRQ